MTPVWRDMLCQKSSSASDLGASHIDTCGRSASGFLLRAQAHEAAMAADWREYQAQYKGLLAVEKARPSRITAVPAEPASLPY